MILTATEVRDDFAVGLFADGLTVGGRYRLWRGEVLLRDWVTPTSTYEVLDVLAPFGVELVYRLEQVDPPVEVVADPVMIAYGPGPGWDVPLFDVADASCPVLRLVSGELPPMRVPVTDYEAQFGYRSQVMPVLGAEWPVVATDAVIAKRVSLVMLTSSSEMRRELISRLRPNTTLHLRSPVVDGLGDLFFRVLDLKETIPVRDRPLLREWGITAQQVTAPSAYGLFQWSRGRTWAEVKALGTWADVKAEGTWLDVRFPDGGPTEYETRPISVTGGEW